MTFKEAEQFIKVYIAAESIDDVCEQLFLDRRAVQNIKAGMKRSGVDLPSKPSLPRRGCGSMTKAEWQELAILAQELQECEAIIRSEDDAAQYRTVG